MNELSLASVRGFKSKHDDCIDTVSMLSNLNTWKPSQSAPAAVTSSGSSLRSKRRSSPWDDNEEELAVSPMSSYII